MPEYAARIVPVAVLSLCRQGELLALRDRDVNFEEGAISITGQGGPSGRTPTKTRAGRRTIDIGPLALRLLREQQLARAPNEAGLLFPTRAGGAFERHNFMRRVFKPAARAAGFPELTFHDLRHTGASLMIAAGCHVKVIADQMGHADGGTLVLRRYGHLYSGARKQAALRSNRTSQELPLTPMWDQCGMETKGRWSCDHELPANPQWAVQGSNLRPPACKAGALAS